MEELAITLRGIGLWWRAAAKTKARDAYVPFLIIKRAVAYTISVLEETTCKKSAKHDLKPTQIYRPVHVQGCEWESEAGAENTVVLRHLYQKDPF